MTDQALIAAFAAAFNNYDASSMEPLLHDTSFHFFSQSSFNEFDTKQEFIDFTARALETMRAQGIGIAAELAYTGDRSEPTEKSVSNVQLWVQDGEPCIYLTYVFAQPFEADYLVYEVDESGEESLVRPTTNVQDFVVCFNFQDVLISEVSFQLPSFHEYMQRTGQYPGR